MRVLVLVLTALAAFKVWATHHMYRSAAEEVIVAAYRERAIAACQKDALPKDAPATAAQPTTLATPTPVNWTRPASIRFVVGRTGSDSNIWDVDSHWKAGARQGVLRLLPADPATRAACEYDITANQAALIRG